MRPYGLAKLLRPRGIQSKVMHRLEALIATRLAHIEGSPPPHDGLDVNTVVEDLFKPAAAFHDRKRGKSQKLDELQRLCGMLNSDLLAGRQAVTHFCWDSGRGVLCCADRDERVSKMVHACASALFGEADPIPAESHWTNALANMKKLLLRACTKRLGLDAFDFGQASGSSSAADIDGDAGQPLPPREDEGVLRAPPHDARAAMLDMSEVAPCFEDLYKLLSGGWPAGGLSDRLASGSCSRR